MTLDLYPKYTCTVGADPELFVGRMVGKHFSALGSEKFVPEPSSPSIWRNVVRDGVQCELRPSYTGCRQGFATSVSDALYVLSQHVSTYNSAHPKHQVAVTFRSLVKMTAKELQKLTPESRLLNCKPSLNAYGREQIKRDGNEYMIRTGSGHIHLGTQVAKEWDASEVVRWMDLIAGIACVLVARSPHEAIRRETYGRAGEYRLPKHGIEYRVPSNFWLVDYRMCSMVTGLVRQALYMVQMNAKTAGKPANQWHASILENVEKAGGWDAVEKAINTNDWDLAMRIYQTAVKPAVKQLGASHYSLCGQGGDDFEYFADTIREDAEKPNASKTFPGMTQWFDTGDGAILTRWTGSFSTAQGWERFLGGVVGPRRHAAKFTGVILDPAKFTAVEPEAKARRRSGAIEQAEQRLAA